MKKRIAAVAAATAAALILAGCSSNDAPAESGGTDITLWLNGGDTPDELRDFLKTEYADATGGTLTIEEQSWSDALAKLTTALPDAENTPDVVEIGNTWAPTFTNAGAFTDLSNMYDELGGDKLLPSFVEVGSVDGAQFALPYYFGSRYMFYRKDVWEKAGITVPATLAEFNEAAAALKTDGQSGFYIGGEDWRNGVSWVFANGGELAVKDGDEWASSLSDPKTVEGLTQLQTLFADASLAPVTEADSTPWVNINNNETTGAPEAATIIAPGWAHWSIGDLAPDPEDATKTVATWNDAVFGTFVLPGIDGGVAPVFAGGSNIAISAASQNQDASKELMKIIFSEDYQKMLGENGLGPANLDYASSLGDDQFATALIDSAAESKLTPAAPGWAAVEGSGLLEEFFGKVNGGGDVEALAEEYDEKINELING
ncbi:sugar ABC transporter substrate-binding protein [Conyzicola nivalis]|uniref:Sugar ABC transporter substrate-binding protein n=1 Tax=Conyzicola nivalis TaxID=1477021 RepID=A0A916SQ81_9MICO|nr:extracellular solute-binding protein [Conyzicola nivalis]GGB12634.1 sugar ABC transporter substrate-binding protein [Conyzicola nivalis]